MPPAEFVHEVLVDRLHAADVVVGRNFRFGHRAAGDVELLTQLGQRFGFGVEGLDLISDDGVTFSSTYIRACIDAGDVDRGRRRARPPAPGGGRGRARRPARPGAGLPDGQHRQPRRTPRCPPTASTPAGS